MHNAEKEVGSSRGPELNYAPGATQTVKPALILNAFFTVFLTS